MCGWIPPDDYYGFLLFVCYYYPVSGCLTEKVGVEGVSVVLRKTCIGGCTFMRGVI